MKIPSNSENEIQFCKYRADLTTSKPLPPSVWLSKRFFVGVMLFSGYLLITMASMVLYDAIKNKMLENRNIPDNPDNPDIRKPTIEENAFCGLLSWCIILNICTLGGYATQNFGGSVVLGVSALLIGTFIVATSFSTYLGFYPGALCLLFIFLSRLILLPACLSAVFESWVPKKERCIFMACVINGIHVSMVVVDKFGWYFTQLLGNPMLVLLVIGVIFIIWALLWRTLVQNTPSSDPRISQSELDYILRETGNPSPPKTDLNLIPLPAFGRNSSDWALSVGKFGFAWVELFLFSCLRKYIKDETQKDEIWKASHLWKIIFVLIIGILVTFWQNHTTRTTTQIYKTVICGAFTISAVLIAAIPITNNFIVLMWCIVLIESLIGCNMIFLEVVTVNMAPKRSALLSSFTSIGQLSAYILVIFIHNILQHQWNVYFFLTAGITLVSGIIFWMFGSSDPHPWPVPLSENDKILRKVQAFGRPIG